jgi:hypothetical protein
MENDEVTDEIAGPSEKGAKKSTLASCSTMSSEANVSDEAEDEEKDDEEEVDMMAEPANPDGTSAVPTDDGH